MADLNDDIANYLKGELSPAERNRLEKMALDDPFLAEALEGAEGIAAEEFQAGVNELHAMLDKRVARKERSIPGWQWAMRIAAVVILIICSTSLIYFYLGNDNPDNLSLNDTVKTLQETKENQPLVADSIADSEPKNETESEKQELEPARKKEPPLVQPSPAPQKEIHKTPIIADIDLAPLAEAKIAEEVSSKEIQIDSLLTQKETTQVAEVESLAKKSAVPPLATPFHAPTESVANTRLITGKVVDLIDGEPLPGVSVRVKGSNTAVATDLEGNYQIPVTETDQVLVFAFVGMESKEEEIEDRTQLNVQLEEDHAALSEMVVIGYGSRDTNRYTSTPADYVEAKPEGGMKAYKKYLEDNLQYPAQAIENKVEGSVTVRFEISETGVISDLRVTKGLGYGCDEEAIRLIREGPKWTAPKKGNDYVKGKVKVRVKFTLPR